jgi:hypothetical protein
VRDAAIFRLDVEGRFTDFHVRIMAKKHLRIRPSLPGADRAPQESSAAFDRLAVESLL